MCLADECKRGPTMMCETALHGHVLVCNGNCSGDIPGKLAAWNRKIILTCSMPLLRSVVLMFAGGIAHRTRGLVSLEGDTTEFGSRKDCKRTRVALRMSSAEPTTILSTRPACRISEEIATCSPTAAYPECGNAGSVPTQVQLPIPTLNI